MHAPHTQTEPTVWSTIKGLVLIPIAGKFIAIGLAFPLLLPLFFIGGTDYWENEIPAEATVTRLVGNGPLYRYVYYEYESENKTHEDRMQWVDTRKRPEIKMGAKLKVYYLADNPFISREEHEPTHHQGFLIALGFSVAIYGSLTGFILHKKHRHRRKMALASKPIP